VLWLNAEDDVLVAAIGAFNDPLLALRLVLFQLAASHLLDAGRMRASHRDVGAGLKVVLEVLELSVESTAVRAIHPSQDAMVLHVVLVVSVDDHLATLQLARHEESWAPYHPILGDSDVEVVLFLLLRHQQVAVPAGGACLQGEY